MPNKFEAAGRLTKSTGGLFWVLLDAGDGPLSGRKVALRARGNLRTEGGLLPGDRVTVEYSESSFVQTPDGVQTTEDKAGLYDASVTAVLPRKNTFIRPSMANLDRLYLILAATRPDPSTLVADKLLSVCEYYGVEPVIVIGKSELAPETAEHYRQLYAGVGYRTFVLSCETGEGVAAFVSYVKETPARLLSAFIGASGAGKSTLLGKIFPEYGLRSGEVSQKTGRGRHTTRTVEVYEARTADGTCLIADTPGFSAVDFVNYDFLPSVEVLPDTMRDFLPFYKDCRWPDCSHTKEEDCGVVRAVREGKIARSRHESYVENYMLLKQKHKWD